MKGSLNMNKIIICLYGIVWLLLLSPLFIFMILGMLCQNQMYPNTVEFIGIVSGTYLYYDVVWMPIRIRMNRYDIEFRKLRGW